MFNSTKLKIKYGEKMENLEPTILMPCLNEEKTIKQCI